MLLFSVADKNRIVKRIDTREKAVYNCQTFVRRLSSAVEHLFCKQVVVGPNPTVGSKSSVAAVPEWSIGTVCKTVAFTGSEGSNPSRCTTILADVAQW